MLSESALGIALFGTVITVIVIKWLPYKFNLPFFVFSGLLFLSALFYNYPEPIGSYLASLSGGLTGLFLWRVLSGDPSEQE
jgi:energy-coupling factor transporter transmembrane protein EcfT